MKEYLAERYASQLDWFDKRSKQNRLLYHSFSLVSLVSAGLSPVFESS
jgi:hypothetical protein